MVVRDLQAGFFYFACVFAVGFALGTLRVLVVAPALGELMAVAVELPFMLLASWVLCRMIVSKAGVPHRVADRLLMGGAAFALLSAAEISLGLFGFGLTLADYFASLVSAEGALGLLAQLIFAFIPLMQMKRA
ncbi:hypothetical protein ACFQ14_08420 [Pseudahrensia aquimaris]|uniref:Uncharacterized protein n=1 Tax=Pseudahrensia aquimaris TaxID=744461 RepID=A0ABW3FG37_9HYPH